MVGIHLHILPTIEVPNEVWDRRGLRRSSGSRKMLCDHAKDGQTSNHHEHWKAIGECRAGRSIGDNLLRQRTPRLVYSHQHASQPFNSEWANPFPTKKLRHLRLEPWRYAQDRPKYHGPSTQCFPILFTRLPKKGVFTQVKDNAIAEEVHKLLDACFIKEVYYLEWLANMVKVKKSHGKWRMCVDFIDLNKACPKDSYPL